MKQLELTKEVRHQIYLKTLKYMKGYDSKYRILLGLCGYLSYIINRNFIAYSLNPYSDMKRLPEIYKHKPSSKNIVWFPHTKEGFDKRISILKQAIKETL